MVRCFLCSWTALACGPGKATHTGQQGNPLLSEITRTRVRVAFVLPLAFQLYLKGLGRVIRELGAAVSDRGIRQRASYWRLDSVLRVVVTANKPDLRRA